MRKIFAILVISAFLASCGGNTNGQLVGVKGKKWHAEKPYGMSLVPGGAFIMGKSDDDMAGVDDAPTKTVTVNSFYMDETEITNSEYRQFVHWTRDSVIRQRLGEEAELSGGGSAGGNNGSIADFAFKGSATAQGGNNQQTQTPYQQYSKHYDPNQQGINWDVDIIWEKDEYPDESYVYVMDEFYLPNDQSYNGMRLMDVTKFVYSFKYLDIEEAARAQGNRSDFIKEDQVAVYPDTTVWIKDFHYSYNVPMHNDYFWHSAYDEYPVVGVSWKQAKAFCDWRTLLHNGYKTEKGQHRVNMYRLPIEAEWEYAARGGLESGTFPWGGPYAMNDRACFLANFKPLRGDYAADQALYTVEADAYEANNFNLYNMSGNVAEWVDSSYDASSYEFYSSMNPNVNDKNNKRKVTRGGSWKDVEYYLQVSTRDYEYSDSARSYIGFRTVQDAPGEDFDFAQGGGAR
ncbi:gliding motility lipoprotein GldK [Mesonia sp. K7]|uniref:type IX secretion system lipoprotein PorK/GldK n=1 Tax=Mesonia sp. K7 TaxID=2218606 RepID=UPI000DA85FFD|nr:gliding motility lipoprotein GldK [Mesonia sp. K7]PZD78715.1 gliding motility lipoprotein GldK [Mesonia sp. K7]